MRRVLELPIENSTITFAKPTENEKAREYDQIAFSLWSSLIYVCPTIVCRIEDIPHGVGTLRSSPICGHIRGFYWRREYLGSYNRDCICPSRGVRPNLPVLSNYRDEMRSSNCKYVRIG